MQRIGLGLRTTIVVNIALVMFITMLLISFLVLTVTRKTIFDYKIKTGETIVTSLRDIIFSSVTSFDEKATALQKTIDAYSANNGELAGLTIVDTTRRVLVDRDTTRVGSQSKDPHLKETLASGTLLKNVKPYQGKDHLFLSAPLYQGAEIKGALQAVLSLDDI